MEKDLLNAGIPADKIVELQGTNIKKEYLAKVAELRRKYAKKK